MATFCIPKHLVEDLKKSAIKGEIKLQELAEMSTAERRAHFEKFTDKETGKFLNTEFEKAIVSKQQGAMLDWAKSVFSPKAQKEASFKNVIDKINEMDAQGVLTPTSEKAFLQDLVAEKLGITVSPAEVKAIAERAKKIDEAQVALGNNLGDPRFENENINFLVEKANMDKYLESLTPASKTKVFTGTIGRGAMLASVKSPLLNVTSNLLFSIPEAIGRRVGNRSFKGADNKKALDYVKFVNKVYQKTGYDLSRMTSLNDTGASGARVLGDTVHSQGPGATRKVGRFFEDVVFKQLMGAPDVAFSSAHFADSVNLGALDLAKGTDYAKRLKSLDGAEKQAFIDATKKEAQDIMTDAMRIEPQTAKGEILRAQGIIDAQYATFTNDSWASKGSLGIRKALNDVTGDVRAGDLSMPFVKTPANMVSTGIDYAGGGAVKGLIDTVNVVRGGDIKSKAYMQKLGRDLTRAGFGLTAAAVIVYNLSEDDFSGAYDPARMQNNDLKNKPFNSFRIGGKWVDADYFGQLAQPVVAMMYAKKYGQGGQDKLAQYASGLIRSTVTTLPGIETVAKEFDKWSESGYKNVQEMKDAASDDIVGFLASRMVPSILLDVAKATDPYERKTGKGWDSLKSRIPGLRQSLPAKVNIFGDEIEGEHPLSELLFGSRVKTDKTTELVKELDKVSEASGKPLTFTDWNRTTSKQVGQFKGGLEPAEFEAAKRKYGQNLKKEVEKVMASNAYKMANDEKKAKLIGDADTDAMNQTFKDYGFKYDKDIKAIPEDKPVSEDTFIGTIMLNAKALKVDPVTYFNRVFTGEKIRRVDNNAIIVERMPVAESQAIKKAGKANTPDFKLDHTVPLVLGGSNSEDNLKIISTAEWQRNTPVEVKLGKLLKDGTIDRKEAQKLIKEFKEGKITADKIMSM